MVGAHAFRPNVVVGESFGANCQDMFRQFLAGDYFGKADTLDTRK